MRAEVQRRLVLAVDCPATGEQARIDMDHFGFRQRIELCWPPDWAGAEDLRRWLANSE